MFVTAHNPSVDDLEETFLSQSYPLGQTSIETKNNQAFSINTRIQIGESGTAQTEIVTVNGTPGTNGTTLPITATLYAHPANTPIYLLQFDEVQFWRSVNGIGGTYLLLTTIPIDVTNEDLLTRYDDTGAQSGYYYEIAMYNSISGATSELSDPVPAVTGWARNQVGYLIDQILTELNDPTEENVTRMELLGYFNECNDDMLMNAVRPYNFLRQRTVLARVAGAHTIPYPTDAFGNPLMWKFDHMDYNFVDNTTNPVTNVTYTVEIAPGLEYFRNRFTSNTSSAATPSNLTAALAAGGSLSPVTTYYYVVTAVYPNNGESGPSTEVLLATVAGFGTIDLTWSGVPGATGYNIYRGLSSGGELLLTTVAAPFFNDTGTISFVDGGTIKPTSQQPPVTTQNDKVQEIALNETMQQFDYYPVSRTSSPAVWYLYYFAYLTALTTEGQTFQTPTPRIYKLFAMYKYYRKRGVTEPSYITISQAHFQDYQLERARYKGQDRRDVGTPRRFEKEGRVRRSFRR